MVFERSWQISSGEAGLQRLQKVKNNVSRTSLEAAVQALVLGLLVCAAMSGCDSRGRRHSGVAPVASDVPAPIKRNVDAANAASKYPVRVGAVSGVVLPAQLPPGVNEWTPLWVPTNELVTEFERGLGADLRRRDRQFDMSHSDYPRRYSGQGGPGQERLVVEFCYRDVGWDDFPIRSMHPPCRFIMHYAPQARRYLGPVEVNGGVSFDLEELKELE